MDFSLSHLFLNMEYQSVPDLMLRCVVLIITSVLLIWLIYFALIRLSPKKNDGNVPRDYFLKQRFLTSLTLFFLIFSVYIFFFIKAGAKNLAWNDLSFYLNLLPQFIVYIGVIIVFIVNYSGYTKSLNK